jgi:hypothetical protein
MIGKRRRKAAKMSEEENPRHIVKEPPGVRKNMKKKDLSIKKGL